jgi:hypothetical protein
LKKIKSKALDCEEKYTSIIESSIKLKKVAWTKNWRFYHFFKIVGNDIGSIFKS